MLTEHQEVARDAVDAVIAEGGFSKERVDFSTTVGQRARVDATSAGIADDDARRIQIRAAEIGQRLWDEAHPEDLERRRIRAGDIRTPPSIRTESVTDPVHSHPRNEPSHGTRRVNVNFSAQAYETLETLAQRTGKSMSDVLREAIALKAWFDQTRATGSHVLVERPDGTVREVISI